MVTWVADGVLAVLSSVLEVAALVAFWFAEGLKQWAAGGKPVVGFRVRLWLVLTAGPAVLAGVSYEAFRAGLPATGVAQALVAAVLAGILALGVGTECSRWAARAFRRSGAGRRARRGKAL
ncbi:hypothetical protein [Streptomyces sp. NPDC001876]|uniref:hypothetical protein n=1 Tax=Streptomyces sp. NPDC001876 TaxID=3154402 RepID=UPI003331A763